MQQEDIFYNFTRREEQNNQDKERPYTAAIEYYFYKYCFAEFNLISERTSISLYCIMYAA